MCKKCGKPVNKLSAEITRNSTCEFCGADLHSCINCKFYSPGSYYDCRESVDELVKEKDRANFCDYFSLAKISVSETVGTSAVDKSAQAKKAFNALFGD